MSELRAEFDEQIWKDRGYWSRDYDSGREPVNEKEARTRNAETVRDSLLDQPQENWNSGTFGDCDCDYTEAEMSEANVLPEVQDESGVRYASADEVQRYYDQLRPLDIELLGGDGDGN